jgi:hypothetical protein
MNSVFDDLIFTEDEVQQIDFWSDCLDADQYEELKEEAWEAGLAEFYAEVAYEKLLPILANAIDRALRANRPHWS